MKYEVICFDLYNTLIKNDPEYKIEKAKLISKYLDIENHEQVAKISSKISKVIDYYVEATGFQPMNELFFASMFKELKLNFNYKEIQNHTQNLVKKLNNLYLKFPPYFFPNTLEIIKDLVREGYMMFIISNTTIIQPETFKILLKENGLTNYILPKRMIFSGEVLFSKPNTNVIFNPYTDFEDIKKYFINDRNKMIHVGDNDNTDGCFAKQMDIDYYNLNNKETNIQTFYNFLQSK